MDEAAVTKETSGTHEATADTLHADAGTESATTSPKSDVTTSNEQEMADPSVDTNVQSSQDGTLEVDASLDEAAVTKETSGTPESGAESATTSPELRTQSTSAGHAEASSANEICTSLGLQPRAKGARKLIAILIAQSASETAVLPMAVAELGEAGADIVIVTPTHSVANNKKTMYSLNGTYGQLEATGAQWSHMTVETSGLDLAAAAEKCGVNTADILDSVQAEELLARARQALLWEGAASAEQLNGLEADTLILIGRAGEIVKARALQIAMMCGVSTPVHFTTNTHRFGFAVRDGAWPHPEIYSAEEAQRLPLSQLRFAREDGREEPALGGYPVNFAQNCAPANKIIAPGVMIDDAGWHVSLFGGKSVVRFSLNENMTPAGQAAVSKERMAEAVESAMLRGSEVFHDDSYNTSSVFVQNEFFASQLPSLVENNYEDMYWAMDPWAG